MKKKLVVKSLIKKLSPSSPQAPLEIPSKGASSGGSNRSSLIKFEQHVSNSKRLTTTKRKAIHKTASRQNFQRWKNSNFQKSTVQNNHSQS